MLRQTVGKKFHTNQSNSKTQTLARGWGLACTQMHANGLGLTAVLNFTLAILQ
jgi:hypothetical protein